MKATISNYDKLWKDFLEAVSESTKSMENFERDFLDKIKIKESK